MKLWIVGLAFVIAAMGYLALAPTDDTSYVCDRVPAALLVDPMPERSTEFFFDEGTRCNADARHRGRTMLGLAIVGPATVVALFAIDRRRELPPTIDL